MIYNRSDWTLFSGAFYPNPSFLTILVLLKISANTSPAWCITPLCSSIMSRKHIKRWFVWLCAWLHMMRSGSACCEIGPKLYVFSILTTHIVPCCACFMFPCSSLQFRRVSKQMFEKKGPSCSERCPHTPLRRQNRMPYAHESPYGIARGGNQINLKVS